MCACGHSYACVYTQGLGTLTLWQRVSATFLTRKNSNFSCAPNGIRTSAFWILSPTLYQLSHPVTPPGFHGSVLFSWHLQSHDNVELEEEVPCFPDACRAVITLRKKCLVFFMLTVTEPWQCWRRSVLFSWHLQSHDYNESMIPDFHSSVLFFWHLQS